MMLKVCCRFHRNFHVLIASSGKHGLGNIVVVSIMTGVKLHRLNHKSCSLTQLLCNIGLALSKALNYNEIDRDQR